jgi:hypothetical protein
MPPPEYSTAYQGKLEEISQLRRELQVEYEAEYERALVEVKDQLREQEVRGRDGAESGTLTFVPGSGPQRGDEGPDTRLVQQGEGGAGEVP